MDRQQAIEMIKRAMVAQNEAGGSVHIHLDHFDAAQLLAFVSEDPRIPKGYSITASEKFFDGVPDYKVIEMFRDFVRGKPAAFLVDMPVSVLNVLLDRMTEMSQNRSTETVHKFDVANVLEIARALQSLEPKA